MLPFIAMRWDALQVSSIAVLCLCTRTWTRVLIKWPCWAWAVAELSAWLPLRSIREPLHILMNRIKKSGRGVSYVNLLALINNSIKQPQIDHGDFAWCGGSKIFLIAPPQECEAVTHCWHYFVIQLYFPPHSSNKGSLS